MKSLFQNLILYLILFSFVSIIIYFADSHFGWELKGGFGGVISAIMVEIIIINSKLDDILESRKTDNYSNGVGIK